LDVVSESKSSLTWSSAQVQVSAITHSPIEILTQADVREPLGGIVALGVFEKNWPLVDAESTFKELVRTAFSKKLLLKLPFLSKVTKYFLSVKYKTEGIDSSLQSAFGEGYLFGQADSVNLGDAVKVAVVTCIEGRNQPTLIANYTRNPLDKLRGGREVCEFARLFLLTIE
jgi:hypothetical protein